MASVLSATNSPNAAENDRSCETQPLLPKDSSLTLDKRKLHYLPSCCGYRLPRITSKGAIAMIAFNFFSMMSSVTCISLTDFTMPQCLVTIPLCLLYPVIGWIGDAWTGKYAILQIALHSLLVTIICQGLANFVIPSGVLHYIALIAWSLSIAGIFASVFQFTMDQSIGASGEELSFIVYWIIWGMLTGTLLSKIDGFLDVVHLSNDMQRLPAFFCQP